MESETRTAEIVEQERDQLICDLFEAVNVMYPPALGESLEVMTSRLIDLKMFEIAPTFVQIEIYV